MKKLVTGGSVSLLASADLFAFPKLDDAVNHVGFSTKLAEFLAAGKSIVASSVGDIPCYLHHGVDVLLCEPGNVRELATNIFLLLSDLDLAGRIGKQGQTIARENFDVKFNVTRMIKVLKKGGINQTSDVTKC